jgi:hypothetical protein
MFAIIAAVLFAIAFILELINKSYGSFINATTLMTLGLFFVALHLAPLAKYTVTRRR